jgi:CBS domain-containing protein
METNTVETRPLISIRASATVRDAADLMVTCGIGALGVLDADRQFSGIYTERDLAGFVARRGDAEAVKIGEVANDMPVIVDGPITPEAALERMESARVRHLIVQQDGDHRIISLRDLIPDLEAQHHQFPATATAADVMNAPAVACRESAYLEEIAEALAERSISGMPVVDETNKLVGVVSERDLAHVLGGPLVRLAVRRGHGKKSEENVTDLPRDQRRAVQVMSTPPITTRPDATLSEIAALMMKYEINRVPVLADGRLVGLVTRGDVLDAMCGSHAPPMVTTLPMVVIGSSFDAASRPSPFSNQLEGHGAFR